MSKIGKLLEKRISVREEKELQVFDMGIWLKFEDNDGYKHDENWKRFIVVAASKKDAVEMVKKNFPELEQTKIYMDGKFVGMGRYKLDSELKGEYISDYNRSIRVESEKAPDKKGIYNIV